MSSAQAKKKVQSKKTPAVKKVVAAKTKKPAVKASVVAKPKVTAKARTAKPKVSAKTKATAVKKKAAPVKKPAAKKAAPQKPQKKLTIAEIFAAVHNQIVQRQENVRHLEHLSNNYNQRFRNGGRGAQMQSPRTVHHSRGK